MPSDPFAALGEFLTAREAQALAVQLAAGRHTLTVLGAVAPARRDEVKRLLAAAGLGHGDGAAAAQVLRAISGAKSVHRDLVPVWTMPGAGAQVGHLTGEFHRFVRAARQSVVCATYNFESSSRMWTVLREASDRPGVVVTLYVNGGTADAGKIKAQLPNATVYASSRLPSGKQVVSHAKFIVIDRQALLLTSANFSFSAENRNVEFGLLVHDSALAESVESTMRGTHGTLYELA